MKKIYLIIIILSLLFVPELSAEESKEQATKNIEQELKSENILFRLTPDRKQFYFSIYEKDFYRKVNIDVFLKNNEKPYVSIMADWDFIAKPIKMEKLTIENQNIIAQKIKWAMEMIENHEEEIINYYTKKE